jgi:hypothetical protein
VASCIKTIQTENKKNEGPDQRGNQRNKLLIVLCLTNEKKNEGPDHNTGNQQNKSGANKENEGPDQTYRDALPGKRARTPLVLSKWRPACE